MTPEAKNDSQNVSIVLPFELWAEISSYLLKKDVKSMRLVSRLLRNAAHFRIERVFLSANPLNIKVLRHMANHEVFRQSVTEIIWDDARFSRGPRRPLLGCCQSIAGYFDEDYEEIEDDLHHYLREEEYQKHEIPDDGEFLDWLFDAQTYCWYSNMEYHHSLRFLGQSECHNGGGSYAPAMQDQIDARLSLEECWSIYKDLYRQQIDVLYTSEDEEAFLYGLRRFPALKRVTITPAAHGYVFHPLYETPMIRSFPKGFIYPIPRTWPMAQMERRIGPEFAYQWASMMERQKDRYRAFRIVTRTLAEEKHNVSELLVQSNYLPTGINGTFLGDTCAERHNLRALFRRSGLRRLDLPLVFKESRTELNFFGKWKPRKLLAEAKEIEDIRISLATLDIYEDPSAEINYLPLQDVLPVEKWRKLCNVEVSRMFIKVPDLINFFALLPETIRSIELKDVHFVDEGFNVWYNDLLNEMRDHIKTNSLWLNKDIASQPNLRVVILHPTSRSGEGIYGRGILLGKTLDRFLYGEGMNPFEKPDLVLLDNGSQGLRFRIKAGFGNIISEFEPDESQDCRYLQEATSRDFFEWIDFFY